MPTVLAIIEEEIPFFMILLKDRWREVNGVGRKWTELLDDLRYRRRYWELQEEAEDKKDGKDGIR